MFDDLLIEKKTAIVISWLNYMLEKKRKILKNPFKFTPNFMFVLTNKALALYVIYDFLHIF